MSNVQSRSSNALHLVANSAALPPFWARFIFAGMGIIILTLQIIQLIKEDSLLNALFFMGLLVLLVGGLIYFVKRANKNIQLTVDSESIESTDDSTISRTAYLSQIKSLRLTGSSLYISYSGGSKERFILPKHSDAEYNNLKQRLQESAKKHTAKFEEKRSWI